MGKFSDVRSDYSGAKTFAPGTPYYIIPEYMASEDSHVTDPRDPYVYIYDDEKDSFKIVGSPLHPKLGLKSLGADFKKGDIAYNILVKRLGKVNEVSNTNKSFINRLIKEELSSIINEDKNRDIIIEKSQILNELELSREFINDDILDYIVNIGGPFVETFKKDITGYLIQTYDIGEELAAAVIDVIQNSSLDDIRGYFTQEGCEKFSDLVFGQYSVRVNLDIEPLIDNFIEESGLVKPDSESYRRLKDEISSRLSNEDMSGMVREEMKEIACSIDLGDVAQTFKTKITDYVSDLIEDVPDWLSGALDMGGEMVSDITDQAQDLFDEKSS